MKKICVLGAGLVGKAIAIDLSKQHKVTSVDINQNSLKKLNSENIQTICGDILDDSFVKKTISSFDLVIGAVPGFMGYKMLKNVIKSKKNIIDISFFPEDPFTLNNLAIKNNVTAIIDCGVAPGMGNIILGYHNKQMEINSYKCYVGGLPKEKNWPYMYKAPFSPIDVIEEYIRPARYVVNNKIVIKDALTDVENIDFPECGTLEAFNTDGLRTLIKTMNISNMIEKTMRYKGSVKYLQALKKTGFFNTKKIEINGEKIAPIKISEKLLLPIWKLNESDEEFTVMKILIKGIENSIEKTYEYNLYDEYNKETKTSSMARTTGYTCTAVANLILEKKFTRNGIIPPEYLGEEEKNFNYIVKYLLKRGIKYNT